MRSGLNRSSLLFYKGLKRQKLKGATVKLFLLPIVGFLLCHSLTAETYWLKPHSQIENPLGLWAIPSGSQDNWANTSLTIFEKNSQVNIYLTYEFSPSDVVPPFTDSEFKAHVLQQKYELKKRNDVVAIVENSNKKRMVNGTEKMTGCGIYRPQSQELWAFCSISSGITFDLFDVKEARLASFFRHDGKWKITIHKIGLDSINKTVSLMLAGLRIFK